MSISAASPPQPMNDNGATRCRKQILNLALNTLDNSPKLHSSDFETIDWQLFYNICAQEKMLHYFSQHGEFLLTVGCPELLVGKAKKWSLASKKRLRWNMFMLETAGAAASKAGFVIAPLKGALLHILRAPHIQFRSMADIDLLVERDRVEEFATLMSKFGFARPLSKLRHPGHPKIVLNWTKLLHSKMGRDPIVSAGHTIDIHWYPVYAVDGHKIVFDIENMWTKIRFQTLGNVKLALVPDSFALAHLLVHCAHSAKEEDLTISRLLDVGILARQFALTFDQLDWAWDSKCKPLVRQSLKLYWDAAIQLTEGNIEPMAQMRLRPVKSSGRLFRTSRIDLFIRIKSWRDRYEFLLGYLK